MFWTLRTREGATGLPEILNAQLPQGPPVRPAPISRGLIALVPGLCSPGPTHLATVGSPGQTCWCSGLFTRTLCHWPGLWGAVRCDPASGVRSIDPDTPSQRLLV